MSVRIVVLGSSASAKALVGAALAARMRARYVDGDDLHRSAGRIRPGADESATEAAHRVWLSAVSEALRGQDRVVVAAGALSRPERDALRSRQPDLWFVELVDDPASAPAPRRSRRRSARRGAAVPEPSAVAPLSSDEAGVRVADDAGLDDLVARIVSLAPQSLR